jgi:type I restriction enzyme S subunit
MNGVPKLRFSEFDEEWQQRSLGQVAKLTSSKRVYLTDYTETGVPFFRGKEITELEKGIIPDDILFISNEAYERFKEKFGAPQAGDILITAVGTLANIFRVREGQKFYFKDGNLIWLREVQQNSEFLEIYLKFSRPAILRSAIGSSQKALTIIALNKLDIKHPSLPEQQKIASFLSSVDKKIGLLRQKKDALELYKKGLMQKIFSQEIRFKQDDGSDFPDWEEVALGEVATIKTGKKDVNEGNPQGKYPFFTCAKNHTFSDSFSFDCDAVLVAGNGEVGHSQKYSGKFEAYQRTYVLSAFKLEFDYAFIVINNLFKEFVNRQTQTGAMPYIKLATLSNFMVPCPSPKEQKIIAKFIYVIDLKIQNTSSQVEQMETFKKGLLQQMFV